MENIKNKTSVLSLTSWVMIIALILFFYFFGMTDQVNEGFTDNKAILKVYNFNTSWCGYSTAFQPEWDKFMVKINKEKSIPNTQAFDIKCDDESREQMCKEYNIEGFPTVIFERGDVRKAYQGPRTSEGLLEAIKSM